MKRNNISVLAVDLGAESGRVMVVHYDGRQIGWEELHRFSNGPVNVQGTLYWDFLRLWSEIQAGIEKGKVYKPASIGVDTWGVDFALLDRQGRLLANPVHYRDDRTEGMLEVVFDRVPRDEVFACTGIQIMRINTLYQLMSLVESGSPLLEVTETFLTCPDLINYWLTGEKASEFTNATTTQMLNPIENAWATEMLNELDIPTAMLPEIIQPGTRLGSYEGIPVIVPACHDTGSAVAAVPAKAGEQYAYISSGTWSLIGLELTEPLLGEEVLAANITNEGGVYGTFRFLKNLNGLWLVQQCRATWQSLGLAYDYGTLVDMAEKARPLVSFINPADPAFLTPGDHPVIVRSLCEKTGQPVPESEGEVIRCILDSLAMAYRSIIDRQSALTNQAVEVIHIVGGGTQNRLLNQLTANATGREVIAGPIEATVLGNALVQLISLGKLEDIHEAREIIGRMDELQRYEPQDVTAWDDAYERYLNIV